MTEKLARKLGFWDVFCVGAGAMISSGLFILPGQAFKVSGPAMVLAYGIAALMVVPAMLSRAELAAAMPKSGGDYFFIERSMGALPGTLAGLATWLSLALKSAFAMIGIGAFAQLLFPGAELNQWTIKWIAAGCCVFFGLMNILSVKAAGRFQIVFVFGLLATLVVFVGAGIPQVQQHPNFDDFLGEGWQAVFATAGLVFISFGGLTKVASIGDEVTEPGRNLPRAMFSAFVVVSLLYVAAVFVVVGTTEAAELGRGPYGSLTPLSLAAGEFLGTPGVVLLSVAAILAFVTTGNAGILAASRNPLAMSRDRLLPEFFDKLSAKYGTPYVSICTTCAFMIVLVLSLDLGSLVKVASTMQLILFLLVNLAVLIMRHSGLQNYKPLFRSPLYPFVQILGIVVYLFVIFELTAQLDAIPLLTLAGFFLFGFAWYFIYVRPRSDRESALLFMVRNAIAREIRRGHMEEELREIALERDEVIRDRFDQLVAESVILDLPQTTTAGEMFRQAAERLAPRIGMQATALWSKLLRREEESSTQIHPGLAIPHVIVEGEGLFDVMLVRCKSGIYFGDAQPPVTTVFILVGSADERNYHLRVLMAIATIVQEEDFAKRWLDARGPEELRDLVLLSGRRRDTPPAETDNNDSSDRKK